MDGFIIEQTIDMWGNYGTWAWVEEIIFWGVPLRVHLIPGLISLFPVCVDFLCQGHPS